MVGGGPTARVGPPPPFPCLGHLYYPDRRHPADHQAAGRVQLYARSMSARHPPTASTLSYLQ